MSNFTNNIIKKEKKIDENKRSNQVSKSHQVKSKFFNDHEIDLHMENLIESWKGLSNLDIVSIQLSSFRKTSRPIIKHISSLWSLFFNIFIVL